MLRVLAKGSITSRDPLNIYRGTVKGTGPIGPRRSLARPAGPDRYAHAVHTCNTRLTTPYDKLIGDGEGTTIMGVPAVWKSLFAALAYFYDTKRLVFTHLLIQFWSRMNGTSTLRHRGCNEWLNLGARSVTL